MAVGSGASLAGAVAVNDASLDSACPSSACWCWCSAAPSIEWEEAERCPSLSDRWLPRGIGLTPTPPAIPGKMVSHNPSEGGAAAAAAAAAVAAAAMAERVKVGTANG
mmetsp:Transcript_6599/g.13670  ORF Transcript_6599/g.13670 Transcript_6599/m.13670 type:complete len:108 (-) Transcript_6599:620-943(-)